MQNGGGSYKANKSLHPYRVYHFGFKVECNLQSGACSGNVSFKL